MHRAEVRQLVSAMVLDQLLLDLRQTPLVLGEYSFSICAAHHADTRSRAGTPRCADERRPKWFASANCDVAAESTGTA